MNGLFILPVELILLLLSAVIFGLSSILLYRNATARLNRLRVLRRYVDSMKSEFIEETRSRRPQKKQPRNVNIALFRKTPLWMRFIWGKRTVRNLAMGQVEGLLSLAAVFPVAWALSVMMPFILKDYDSGLLPMLLPAFLIVRKVIVFRANRRMDRIVGELPSFIGSIVRSTRLGSSFDAAFSEAIANAHGPLVVEMQVAQRAMGVGQTASSALRSIAVDLGLIELKMFAGALTAQENSGGSIADSLDNIALTIRTKHEIRKKIEAMSAQGFTSAIALILAPLAIFIIIQWMQPDFYAEVYKAGAAGYMLGFCAVLMSIGYFIMKKIAKIEI